MLILLSSVLNWFWLLVSLRLSTIEDLLVLWCVYYKLVLSGASGGSRRVGELFGGLILMMLVLRLVSRWVYSSLCLIVVLVICILVRGDGMLGVVVIVWMR